MVVQKMIAASCRAHSNSFGTEGSEAYIRSKLAFCFATASSNVPSTSFPSQSPVWMSRSATSMPSFDGWTRTVLPRSGSRTPTRVSIRMRSALK